MSLASREYGFFRDRDVLHFAPEPSIRDLVLSHRPRSYTTADLFAFGVHLKENIESLTIVDGSFDLAICLHVLEHVNDRKAARELFRVLRPGGILLAMFPIVEGWDDTFQDPARTTAEERLLYFGQRDHMRFFGRDARKRLAASGFSVEEYTAVEPNVSRYGLSRGEKIFICSRPAAHCSAVPDDGVMGCRADAWRRCGR
ncbi:MAG: methyltransferase domain-containing protein [Rhodomicrobiaceae bacterium]